MHSVYAVCIYRVDTSIPPHVNNNAFIRFNKGRCSDCRLGWLWLSGSVPPQNATNCSFSIDRFRCKLWKWESEYKELWMLVVLWMSIIRIRLTTGFTCAYWAHLFIEKPAFDNESYDFVHYLEAAQLSGFVDAKHRPATFLNIAKNL